MRSESVPDEIDRIVAVALDADVRTCFRPTRGSVAETFVLDLGSTADTNAPRRVVCKRGGASVWTGDVIEPLVVDRVARATEISVPDVLASGSLVGGNFEDAIEDAAVGRWALYDSLDGTNPAPEYTDLDPAVRLRLVADAGAYLGQLHATSLDATPADVLGYDRVGGLERSPAGCELQVRDPDGWHVLDSGASFPFDVLPVPLADDPDCVPVLTHGDYQPGNLLIAADGSVTGVLDWGNAHVTHAGYAVGRAETRFIDLYAGRISRAERTHLRRTFRSAYARHAPLDEDFDRRARWYKLLWLLQSGANYAHIARSARGRTQLRRQCRRVLGD